jgi:ribosomal protein S18 acetylase RimI-like enzyme
MPEVVVTRLDPDDWAVLRAARLAALADAPEAFGSTTARELAFDEAEWRRRISTSPSFVAWRPGEPVGLVSVVNRAVVGGQGSTEGWELVSMWVSPTARGTGAAELLASAVLDAVRAARADRVTLWVADDNARARAFYLRFGFTPTGARQEFRRHDGSVFDEEELALALCPGQELSSQ